MSSLLELYHTINRNQAVNAKSEALRKEIPLSQRAFAEKLQIAGLDIDKNAIQRIECGKRFVTDIELIKICEVLNITPNQLLHFEEEKSSQT